MATTLTTNAGAVKVYVNGIFNRSLPKGSFSVANDGKKLRLEHPSYHAAIMVDVDTTLDGTSYDSLDALANALSAFNRGGTGPNPTDGVQSVTGDFVDNTDPANPVVNHPDTSQVHHEGTLPGNPDSIDYDGDLKTFLLALAGETQGLMDLSHDLSLGDGQFLVGTADGNEKRTLRADDLRTNQGGTGTHVPTILPQLNQIGPSMPFRNTPEANSLAQRSGDGRLKGSPATEADDLVQLSQLTSGNVTHSGILTPNGGTLIGDVSSFLNNYANSINTIHLRTNKVINNDLTDATTSAELDSLYNNAVLGFEAISITGLVKFTFLDSGSWAKETIVVA